MNNTEIIDKIINSIYDIQINANANYWKEGIFPNFRSNKLINYKRPDNSIFFTASIVYILQNIKKDVSFPSQKKIEIIVQNAQKNYKDFKSATGENIYNFYPTQPSRHFGNGHFFRHFKHFQLPHDADDTALIYLTAPFSKDENRWFQQKLVLHSNNYSKKIKNTFVHYKHLKAYSTWFGKNMAIEFDTCVLSNILLAQLNAGLQLDSHGLDSWEYIKQTILSGEYITCPFFVSHNYAKTEIIAYHVARLIYKYELPDGDIVKQKLKEDLIKTITTDFTISNLILSITLAKLGVKYEIKIPNELNYIEINNYSFFLAGLLSSYENPILQKAAKWPISQIEWTCPAHNLALIVENMIYSKKNEITFVR